MDSSSIQLADSEIDAVHFDGSLLRIHFARAYIVKTMTGSAERTLWWQAGELVLEDAEIDAPLPVGPVTCAGGDVDENIYTYRDMIPIPLESRGAIRVALQLRDHADAILARGSAVRLQLAATPKYIRHIRD